MCVLIFNISDVCFHFHFLTCVPTFSHMRSHSQWLQCVFSILLSRMCSHFYLLPCVLTFTFSQYVFSLSLSPIYVLTFTFSHICILSFSISNVCSHFHFLTRVLTFTLSQFAFSLSTSHICNLTFTFLQVVSTSIQPPAPLARSATSYSASTVLKIWISTYYQYEF